MKINIKGTNMTVTPDIADYLHKKIDSLDKFIDSDDTSVLCEVEIGRTTRHKTGDVFRTEISIRKDGRYFRAVAEEASVLAAIDEAKDDMARELNKDRSRQITMIRRGGAAIKNILRGVGSGIGAVGSGFEKGYKQLKRLNWRRRRRD